MKILISIVIWNKHDMIPWLISGIKKSFKPDQVHTHFLLDNPVDGSDQMMEHELAPHMGEYTYTHETIFKLPTFKFHIQNLALQKCVADGYDLLICPQDDQKFDDPYLYQNLCQLYTKYGDRLGLIGGRDGFKHMDFKDATGSYFSNPIGEGYRYLHPGEHREVDMLNDGPLIYNRRCIERVGLHDEEFFVFCSEMDYSKRCRQADLVNINLGMSVIHEKFHVLRSNLYYPKHNYSQLDHDRFAQKWPSI